MSTRFLTANSLSRVAHGLGGATFMLLPAWGALLSLRAADLHWMSLVDLFAISIALSLYYFLITQLRGWGRILLGAPLMVFSLTVSYDAVVFLYDSLRGELLAAGVLDGSKSALRWIFWGIVLATPMLLVIYRRHLAAWMQSVAGLFALVFLVLVIQFVYLKAVSTRDSNQSPTTVAAHPVVVLIFDELDADLLTAKLNKFPAFKLLAEKATLVGNVYPPSNYTHISLPAMLAGQPLLGSKIQGKNVYVTLKTGGRREPLHAVEQLFKGAIDQSRQISLIGWHLPYCAVFEKIPRCLDDTNYGVPGEMLTTFQWLYGKSALLLKYRQHRDLAYFGDIDAYSDRFFNDPRNFRLRKISPLLDELQQRLLSDVGSGHYDLVFAHLPCPHLPRLDGQASRGMMVDYDDNLSRCDQILGTVINTLNRKDMPLARLVVTSDHWFRPEDWKRKGGPGEYAQAPRKVPFYYVAGDAGESPIRVDSGSNIRLAKIVNALMMSDPVDAKSIESELMSFGAESTFLDKF